MTGPERHRFFADSIAEDVVPLPTDQAHHALHVLRLADGAVLEVFDGIGGVGEGVLRAPDRRGASVELTRRWPADPPTAPAVELGFAVPKGKRLDWLLEKATELGAGVLAPVVFAHSVARPDLSGKARDRWRAHCIAAAKQCGADLLPEIRPPAALTDFLARPCPGVFGDPAAGQPLSAALAGLAGAPRLRILVGPEGGMTKAERAAAEAAGLAPVRLGGYVLRIETAAVAMLAAIRAGGTYGAVVPTAAKRVEDISPCVEADGAVFSGPDPERSGSGMERLRSAEQVHEAIDRLFELVDSHLPADAALAVIGIRTRGEILARRLVALLREKRDQPIDYGVLDITFYRDDLSLRKGMPLVRATEIDFDLDGKVVLLVDDVLMTGRSVRAAMDALVDFGRPKAIRLAVLVDRGGRELPIAADFVGERLDVDPTARIQVHLVEHDKDDGVFLILGGRRKRK